MFEKEAEEYKKLPKWKGKIFMKDEETCYKDGAEIGYNKAKEELEKDNNRLFLEGAKRIEELEKENFSLKEQYGKLKKLLKRLYDETSNSVINRGFDIQLFDEVRRFLENE